MKKTKLLNAPMSCLVAQLGHGDSICIGDAGLPVPQGVNKIDLAVCAGVPSLLEVFYALTSEMFVERIAVAQELQDQQPQLMRQLVTAISALEASQSNDIVLQMLTHENLKATMRHCKASVRTGECTPFANMLVYAGVNF